MAEISAPMATIMAALVGIVVASLTAVLTYATTKKREREAEIRKEKLEHYKDFMASLSGIISGEQIPGGQQAFAKACNKLNLIAPHTVIVAMQSFQQEIKISNLSRTNARHDELMSFLIHAMRDDLGLRNKGENDNLVLGLWSSGVPTQTPE